MASLEQRHYEMGYTEKEFTTVLTGEFTGRKSIYLCAEKRHNQWLISTSDSDLAINIDIKKSAPRVLGAISLPVLDVNFSVNADPQDSALFFDKFFKYFHKGGG